METIKLLEELTAVPALSGYEDAMISVLRNHFESYADEVYVDRLGNLIASVRGSSDHPKLLIFAHMDELGLVVRKIESKGFLRFERVGGVPEKSLLGQWVEIHTDGGERIPGLIGTTSHHVTPSDKKYAIPSRLEMYIDIGCSSQSEVEALGVQVGNGITYRPTFKRLSTDLIAAKSLDNRVGCTILVQTLAALSSKRPKGTVYIVSSVQEEFNVRGVWPAFQRIMPDAAICLEVTIACDTPELEHLADMKIGGGPAISMYQFHGRGTLGGLIPNPKLRRYLEQVAEEEGIPTQREVLLGVITDASFSQMLGLDGVPMSALAVPIRYSHAPVEVGSLSDIDKAIRLVTTAARRFDETVDLTRGG